MAQSDDSRRCLGIRELEQEVSDVDSISQSGNEYAGSLTISVDSDHLPFTQSTPESVPSNHEGKKTIPHEEIQKWFPFWLRQPILGALGFLFFFLAIALPVMLFFSQRNKGLLRSSEGYAYVWRFVPTASMLTKGAKLAHMS